MEELVVVDAEFQWSDGGKGNLIVLPAQDFQAGGVSVEAGMLILASQFDHAVVQRRVDGSAIS